MSDLERWAKPQQTILPSREEKRHNKSVERLVNQTKLAGLQVDAEAALTGRIMERTVDLDQYRRQLANGDPVLDAVLTRIEIGYVDNVHAAVADEQSTLRELHAALKKKLADIDKREERLIDLAEEGLPQHKIRERLNKINEDRARLEADLNQSGAALAVGASLLEDAIRLAADVRQLYADAENTARAALNDAIFKRLFVDEGGVRGAELREPFKEITEAADLHGKHASVLETVLTNSTPGRGGQKTTRARGATHTLSYLVASLGVNNLQVSTKHLMAEREGFEPSVP